MSKHIHGHDTPSTAGFYNGIAGTAYAAARGLGRGEVDVEALEAQKQAARTAMMLQAAAPIDPEHNPHDRLRTEQFELEGGELAVRKQQLEEAHQEVSRAQTALGRLEPEPRTTAELVVGTLAVAALPGWGLYVAVEPGVGPNVALAGPGAVLLVSALFVMGWLGAARDDRYSLPLWFGAALLGAAATVMVWLASTVPLLAAGAGLFQFLVLASLAVHGRSLWSAWQRHRAELPDATLRRQALADAQRVVARLEGAMGSLEAARQRWKDEVEDRTHMRLGAEAHANAAEQHAEDGFIMGVKHNYGDTYGAHAAPPSATDVRARLRQGKARPVLDDA